MPAKLRHCCKDPRWNSNPASAQVKLKDGRTLYIREARLDEAPKLLTYMEKIMKVDHDFYDIVGRTGLLRNSGLVSFPPEGPLHPRWFDRWAVWAGFANGRLMNEDINISLHTMALLRGGRIGAVMYYAKPTMRSKSLATRNGGQLTKAIMAGCAGVWVWLSLLIRGPGSA